MHFLSSWSVYISAIMFQWCVTNCRCTGNHLKETRASYQFVIQMLFEWESEQNALPAFPVLAQTTSRDFCHVDVTVAINIITLQKYGLCWRPILFEKITIKDIAYVEATVPYFVSWHTFDIQMMVYGGHRLAVFNWARFRTKIPALRSLGDGTPKLQIWHQFATNCRDLLFPSRRESLNQLTSLSAL